MIRHFRSFAILLVLSAAACAQTQAYSAITNPTQNQNAQVQNSQAPNSASLQTIYLPSGLDIQIRVNESLTSATAQTGDTFSGTLVNSIEDDNGNIIFERGTQVTGRVISAKPSGRLQDSGQLVLSLNNIRSDKQIANVTVISKEVNGASHAGSNTAKVGGGALLGAILGGLAGGGKGAAIGAGVGAGAGTGAAAATGRKEAKVDPESILRFVTSTETTVVPVGSAAAQAMENQPSVYNGNSGSADANAPVLRRRNGSAVPPDSNSTSAQSNSTIVSNASADSDAPVMRRRDNPNDSGVTVQEPEPTATTSNSPSANAPATVSTPTSPTQFSFSARERRVITNCLADNPGSAPAATTNAIPYHKGDTLPYAAQKSMRSLPLACERQLEPISNDLERVIYNQQVLLIDSNSLVLDSVDLPKQ